MQLRLLKHKFEAVVLPTTYDLDKYAAATFRPLFLAV